MEKEIELPAWKLRAIERGAIPDPRIKPSPEIVPERKKEKRKDDTPGERRVSLWVKPDVCTKLQHLAVFLGLPPGSSLGDVVYRLAADRMEEFRDLEDILNSVKTEGER